jgi:hypothetical protein
MSKPHLKKIIAREAASIVHEDDALPLKTLTWLRLCILLVP